METGNSVERAHADIAQALAGIDAAASHRHGSRRAIPNPSLKPLVLMVIPTACVRRVGGSYRCFIGDRPISPRCTGEHATPDRAWICLARFVHAHPLLGMGDVTGPLE